MARDIAEILDLEGTAAAIKTRLALIPVIARNLKNDRPFTSDTDGYGIRIGKLRRFEIRIYADQIWGAEHPSLWSGFQTAKAQTFDDILQADSIEFPAFLTLEDRHSIWVSEETWRFKPEIERPRNFGPVLERTEPAFFGVYYFGGNWELFAASATSFLIQTIGKLLELELLKDGLKGLSATVKEEVNFARRGQGKYRERLSLIESGCRITGVKDPRLLRASHMKPWSLCETSKERLDGNNGLLLTPTFDLMFDKGYLTFRDDGTPILSTVISKSEIDLLSMPDLCSVETRPFSEKQKFYLNFHRNHIFQAI